MKVTAGKNGEVVIYDFNKVEALKIAVHLEKEGIAFYEQLRGKLKDEGIRSILRFLCAQEKEHLLFFEQELTDELGYEVDGFEDDELLNYVESGIFGDEDGVFNVDVDGFDAKRAITLAVDAEERSVQFYENIFKNTEDLKGKEMLRSIIIQEAEHREKLKKMLTASY